MHIPKKFFLRFHKKDIAGMKVLVRFDFNLDIVKGKILDDYRIHRVLPTIQFLQSARQTVIITHLGRPAGRFHSSLSLKHLVPDIESVFGQKVRFVAWKPGERLPNDRLLLLENIRFFKEEEEQDKAFAQSLASLGDVFVNDAFSVSHRRHTSTALLPQLLPSYLGLVFERELSALDKVLKPRRPFVLIIGGAKITNKLPLIKHFLDRADAILVGGGVGNTWLKAQGYEIGASLFDKDALRHVRLFQSPKVLPPIDTRVLRRGRAVAVPTTQVKPMDEMCDIGPATIALFKNVLSTSNTIIWAGPMGKIEDSRFAKGSLLMAKFLAALKNDRVIGGGDTLVILHKLNLFDKFTHVSTGGGAMLTYVAGQKMPGIEAVIGSRTAKGKRHA